MTLHTETPARYAELHTGAMAKPTPPPVALGVAMLTYACAAATVLVIIALTLPHITSTVLLALGTWWTELQCLNCGGL
jgi:hypothetical protein